MNPLFSSNLNILLPTSLLSFLSTHLYHDLFLWWVHSWSYARSSASCQQHGRSPHSLLHTPFYQFSEHLISSMSSHSEQVLVDLMWICGLWGTWESKKTDPTGCLIVSFVPFESRLRRCSSWPVSFGSSCNMVQPLRWVHAGRWWISETWRQLLSFDRAGRALRQPPGCYYCTFLLLVVSLRLTDSFCCCQRLSLRTNPSAQII